MDWVVAWRGLNVLLSAVSLYLLLEDTWHRKRLHLRARFYWEAVALLLISTGWASAIGAFDPSEVPFSAVRTTVATVALVYFLISIVRVRRFNRREEESLGVTR